MNQTLLLFFSQVMFGSSIMNIQVTTIKHLTLEIISMNLQVSSIKKKKSFIKNYVLGTDLHYLSVCVCVHQA